MSSRAIISIVVGSAAFVMFFGAVTLRQQELIRGLQYRLDVMEGKLEVVKRETASEISKPVSGDSRTLLTMNNVGQYAPKPQTPGFTTCDEGFNVDAPSATANYLHQDRDFLLSFDVPYNSKWGSDRFKINPYDEGSADQNLSVSFGPFVSLPEGCVWARKYKFQINNKKTDQALQQGDGALVSGVPDGKFAKVNGYTVLKYIDSGLCDDAVFDIAGQNANYQFTAVCTSDTQKDFKLFESIVSGLKLEGG